MFDLRSDTVTKPTAEMRRVMAEAEVGDDVFGEDPTVKALEAYVADLLGKEAALFVTSGTMSNQLAVKIHTQPGDEVLGEAGCHIFNYESGGAAFLSGVQFRPMAAPRGLLEPEMVTQSLRSGAYWEPVSRLLCVENTHNKAGGTVYAQDRIAALADVARQNGLGFHLDGARIWNAAAMLGLPEREIAAPFDTVSVCLSKGLGAPVGSVLVGSAAHIRTAHRFRKMWGGGMRQSGILAAAGLHALQHHRADLVHDHARAKRLAMALTEFPHVRLDPENVETNIIMFDVSGGTAAEWLARLRDQEILMVAFGPQTIRATLHRDLSDADLDEVIMRLRRTFG